MRISRNIIVDYLHQLEPLDELNQQLQANVHPTYWRNPRPAERYNLVVVGAGTAGLVAAAGAAGLGAKVALVERGLMGGDCLNVGCVPSKGLIAAARRAAAVRDAMEYGIVTESSRVEFADAMQRMRRLRASISPHDSAQRFTELGVDVFFGQGTFTSRNTLTVGGQELRFAKAVIATGARASELPIPGLKETGYLTNETLFSLTELPRRLIVVGGGPIGCEMAQAFARLGSAVTQIEMASHVLSREESDAAQIVQSAMQRDGVTFVLNAKLLRVDCHGGDKIVTVQQDGQERTVHGDAILVGIGRTPNLDGLGLDTAGVNSDPTRGVDVDDRLRTTNRNIYAAGDVCSGYKFTHAADFLARIVIQNALFKGRAKASKLLIPWCTYTSPEIAHVGIYPHEAARGNVELTTYTQPLSGIDRAILDGESEGFVRVYCRKGTDRILGATIVAAHAGDLIGEIVLAMKHQIGLGKIASTIHPYPTQAEAIRKLGDQYNRTKLTPLVKRAFATWLRWTR
jgi:pyruvate/2-oxoglutarate dehydrogenase complex dihydrolipoamide dehydrogenase (E3) component